MEEEERGQHCCCFLEQPGGTTVPFREDGGRREVKQTDSTVRHEGGYVALHSVGLDSYAYIQQTTHTAQLNEVLHPDLSIYTETTSHLQSTISPITHIFHFPLKRLQNQPVATSQLSHMLE